MGPAAGRRSCSRDRGEDRHDRHCRPTDRDRRHLRRHPGTDRVRVVAGPLFVALRARPDGGPRRVRPGAPPAEPAEPRPVGLGADRHVRGMRDPRDGRRGGPAPRAGRAAGRHLGLGPVRRVRRLASSGAGSSPPTRRSVPARHAGRRARAAEHGRGAARHRARRRGDRVDRRVLRLRPTLRSAGPWGWAAYCLATVVADVALTAASFVGPDFTG